MTPAIQVRADGSLWWILDYTPKPMLDDKDIASGQISLASKSRMHKMSIESAQEIAEESRGVAEKLLWLASTHEGIYPIDEEVTAEHKCKEAGHNEVFKRTGSKCTCRKIVVLKLNKTPNQ